MNRFSTAFIDLVDQLVSFDLIDFSQSLRICYRSLSEGILATECLAGFIISEMFCFRLTLIAGGAP